MPSLDGWRALAITGVLLSHDEAIGWHGHALPLQRHLGEMGVVLFFALSGILISWRILEEESLEGMFHLKRFYVRRFFRIQPAALLYLGAVAVLALAGAIPQSWRDWWAALLLCENFFGRTIFFVGQFWTLGVEEHFYLLVSLLFFYVRRRRVWALLGILIVLRIGQKVAEHYVAHPDFRRTYWQIQQLLWPALLAILLRRPEIRAHAVRWLRPFWVIPVTLGAALAIGHRSEGHGETLLFWSFGLWVGSTMLHPESWTTRVLEWKPLRFVGRISYSLYLWHLLFDSRAEHIVLGWRMLDVLSERPWKYLAMAAVALLSYYFIEKPSIRLGHRLAPPATPGHRDLGGGEQGAVKPTTA